MSAQIADFNIRFNTETAKFQKDVDYAKKMLRGYTKEAKAANDENVGLSKSLESTADGAKTAAKGVLEITGAVTAGLGAVAGATGYLISRQAEHARQIERMATVSQTSVEQIQALGYASEQYNISGETMADILKDVNDKLGDFSENEGGEFADFMENIAPKVGLTIEKLQQLSGPEALIAVKTAMDAANVPMKSQIFYLESIANDASALMPLLDKQGQKLYELTDKFDDLNVSMSEYDIEKFKEMDQKLKDVGLKLEKSFANAVLGASDQIDWFTDKMVVATDYWGSLFDSWSDDPRTVNGLSKKIQELQSERKVLSGELREVNNTFKEYEGVDADSLLRFNPLGRSENELFNLNSDFGRLTKQIEEIDAEIERQQKRYNKMRFGMNYDVPQPSVKPANDDDGSGDSTSAKEIARQQQAGQQRLAALDVQYADEREKLKLSHEQRLEDIENLKLSEQEIEQRGFDSLAAIKAEYKEREKEFYDTELEDFERKQDEAIQREIDAYIAKEDAKTKAAERASKQRADTEKRIEQSVLSMKFGLASQGLSLIEQTAKQGSFIQKAAFAAQKAMAAAQVYMQGEVAATAALAPPPIGLGPIAGVGQAMVIRTLAAASAGLIMGQAVAGMAHNGIEEVPMFAGRSESNWTLKAGERVYTNESARRIDQMYRATMSMYRQPFAANDPTMAYQNRMAANGSGASAQPWTIIIHEAEPGTHAEIDDENKVLNIMMKDAQSGGKYFSYISKTLGVQPGGFK
ncbi:MULTISPECIES: hypothetical protein [unclassified Vibrio]|uniref:hypothetical protein n=1 Tax=unclassified Vibrio TaxID=2614977 RepID=UPI001A8D7608|nr:MULTISPECIES: hypothetical protein [unclassified Vibrio]MBO0243274.1 hypothetical protein [Vibrio sp. Vb0592]MDW1732455.1 hypothetical protein [Vibrio sp. Vb2235]MDW1784726.1 hypothetical protein [Vibrio sp. Vb2227]MDW1814358.1 hypothetical protein [Vibrio sp. Vb2232]MDW1864554.1 hypothetical protein [Vibrio sp. Vb1127]